MPTTRTSDLSTRLDAWLQGSASGDRLGGLFVHLLRLLARGSPVSVGELASAAGRPEAEVHDLLANLPSLEREPEGRIVGQGLTLNPTRHKFTIAGRDLYTWCALDSLMFPFLLSASATVESPCRGTGVPVRLRVSPRGVESVEPREAVVSIVVPASNAKDVRSAFCHHVHFFASSSAAVEWLNRHPEAKLLSVAEAFELGRKLARRLEPSNSPIEPMPTAPVPDDQEE